MAKKTIHLTIKTTYLSAWGAYEGIRELVQNGRDSEIDGHPLKVDWYKDTLRLENEGVVLPVKALLLGHTTKEGRSDQIGKFGEGLKLGVLALVRAGHAVKIRNGSEVWIPTIERSETFDEDVLTFRIEDGRKEDKRLRIEVGGITKEAWEKMKTCFLFLTKPKDADIVATYYGTLLTGSEHCGKVFVKGIFVQTDPQLRYGYDLKDGQLDRDRKMVEAFNLRYHTRHILMLALNHKESLLPEFAKLLETQTAEVESITEADRITMLSDAAAKFVADDFKKKYGEDAVPVRSIAESKDVEHLGKKGVVVTPQLGTVLEKTLGDALTVKASLKKEVTKLYGWGELSDVEKKSLEEAVELVNVAEPVKLDEIDIVDFRSEDLLGQFKDRRILLAKKNLADPNETLATLIHEAAHRGGAGDGDHSHIARVETIWKKIVGHLRAR